MGLLRLLHVPLRWRQIEVFLLWICPPCQGSNRKIAEVLAVSEETVKTHREEACLALQERLGVKWTGKGAHAAAYHWAVREGIVDPFATPAVQGAKTPSKGE